MKVLILGATKKAYWYSDMVGEVRHVTWSLPKFAIIWKTPMMYLKHLLLLEDREKSNKLIAYKYAWKDIKIVSLW